MKRCMCYKHNKEKCKSKQHWRLTETVSEQKKKIKYFWQWFLVKGLDDACAFYHTLIVSKWSIWWTAQTELNHAACDRLLKRSQLPKDERVEEKITPLGHSGGALGCWLSWRRPQPQAWASELHPRRSGNLCRLQGAGAERLCSSAPPSKAPCSRCDLWPQQSRKKTAAVLLLNAPGFVGTCRKL